MIELTEKDIGIKVVYKKVKDKPEYDEIGIIKSFNDDYVGVDYNGNVMSTKREKLEWYTYGMDETFPMNCWNCGHCSSEGCALHGISLGRMYGLVMRKQERKDRLFKRGLGLPDIRCHPTNWIPKRYVPDNYKLNFIDTIDWLKSTKEILTGVSNGAISFDKFKEWIDLHLEAIGEGKLIKNTELNSEENE